VNTAVKTKTPPVNSGGTIFIGSVDNDEILWGIEEAI
jgi:hypothetical protein